MLRRFSFLALIVALAMVFSTMAMADNAENYTVNLIVNPSIEAFSEHTLTLTPNGTPDATSSVVDSSGYFKSNGPTILTYSATALKRTQTGIGAGSGVIDYLKTSYDVQLYLVGGADEWVQNLNLTGDNDLNDTTNHQTSYGPTAGAPVYPHGGRISIKVSVNALPLWDDDSGVYSGTLGITASVDTY